MQQQQEANIEESRRQLGITDLTFLNCIHYMTRELDLNVDILDGKERKITNDIIRKLTDSGWQAFRRSTQPDDIFPLAYDADTGYGGCAFFNRNIGQLIISHRGLQFNENGNLTAALLMALQSTPTPLFEQARQFTRRAIEEFTRKFGGAPARIIHAGFSLGGYISSYCAGVSSVEFGNQHYAVCYDSPGAGNDVARYFHGRQDFSPNIQNNIFLLLTSPNIVNVTNPHFGQVLQITHYRDINRYTYKPEVSLMISFQGVPIGCVNRDTLSNAAVLLLGTLRTHDQDRLRGILGDRNYFDTHPVTADVWPLAENRFLNIVEAQQTDGGRLAASISRILTESTLRPDRGFSRFIEQFLNKFYLDHKVPTLFGFLHPEKLQQLIAQQADNQPLEHNDGEGELRM
ncbi:MAG: hypothetical protein K2X50_02530 [Gammaproteobacteria bacterium]|nr:hypothetical protein [Gammaproteobacteria bacterium]